MTDQIKVKLTAASIAKCIVVCLVQTQAPKSKEKWESLTRPLFHTQCSDHFVRVNSGPMLYF